MTDSRPAIELSEQPRILVIRRDNIGDLLCTTPLLAALRKRFPKAWIGVLANAYNAPVLDDNPDVDEVFAYEKGKHQASLLGRAGGLMRRLALIRELRRRRPDVAILAAPGFQRSALRFARLIAPHRVLGYRHRDATIDIALPPPASSLHEVEASFGLLDAFGIGGPPPAMKLAPDPARVAASRSLLPPGDGPLIGLHVSARKPAQRWPVERFAALARALQRDCGARFLLFWAPGGRDHPQHPGDDETAAKLTQALGGMPLLPLATHQLSALIAGLSLCDQVICSDGGAMHIAAALGKPIVCFFGNSDASRWHPWGVAYELLQPASRDVGDVTVEEALAAWTRLQAGVKSV